MRTNCPDPSDRPAPADLEAHLAQCPDCRAQWRMHREMLDQLGGRELPQLSQSFNVRIRRRLEQEAALAEAPAWPRLALRLYWSAAALVSLLILIRADWASLVSLLAPEKHPWALLVLLASPIIALLDLSWLRRLAGATWRP